MFDSFISSLKSQRVDVSASLSDIRCRISGWSKSSFNISNQNINRNIENSKSIPKSQSFAIGNSRKLQWPVLGNNNERKWISSLSLESSKANVYSSEACEASEKAVIYNNPTHSLKDEESDDECLIEKFDRASENRRNDREEIRKRLAMGIDAESSLELDKAIRKPSLQSRLQNGTNLQICFMNETASDGSDTENQKEALENGLLEDTLSTMTGAKMPASLPPMSTNEQTKAQQTPVALDFFSQQAKLQQEARTALAQAKELARIQMQVERQQRKHTRMSDLVRQSLEKLGIPFPWDCRRLSRQILTELNIAQLQVIVNDLHTQIESLNEELVQLLLKRDDCHMEQDSMLVDIEDLTRYLTAKQMAFEAANWNGGPVSLPAKSDYTASAARPGMRPAHLMDARK